MGTYTCETRVTNCMCESGRWNKKTVVITVNNNSIMLNAIFSLAVQDVSQWWSLAVPQCIHGVLHCAALSLLEPSSPATKHTERYIVHPYTHLAMNKCITCIYMYVHVHVHVQCAIQYAPHVDTTVFTHIRGAHYIHVLACACVHDIVHVHVMQVTYLVHFMSILMCIHVPLSMCLTTYTVHVHCTYMSSSVQLHVTPCELAVAFS